MTSQSPYRSELRKARASETRARILDGLVATLGNGIAGLSIPAVARSAGVAVPTVYKHFRNKRALLRALGPHVAKKSGLVEFPEPRSPEDLAATVPDLFRGLEEIDDSSRALMASEIGMEIRRSSMVPARLRMVEAALAPAMKGLSRADRKRLCNTIVVLWSSAALRAFKDYLSLSTEEAADDVAWAITALARGAREQKG